MKAIDIQYNAILTKLKLISSSFFNHEPNTLDIIKNNITLLRNIQIATLLDIYEYYYLKRKVHETQKELTIEKFILIYKNLRSLSTTPNLCEIQLKMLNITAIYLIKRYESEIVPYIIETINLQQTYSFLPTLFTMNLDFPLLRPLIEHIKTTLKDLSTKVLLGPLSEQTLKKQVFDQLPSYILYICEIIWNTEKLTRLTTMVDIAIHKTFTNNIPCLIKMDEYQLRKLGIKESLLQFDNTKFIERIVNEFSKTAPVDDIETCVNILIKIFETVPFTNTRDVDDLVNSFLNSISSKEDVLDFLFFRDNNKFFWNKCWCDIVEDEFDENTLGAIPYDEASTDKNFTSKNLLPSFLNFLGDKTEVINKVSNIIIEDLLNTTNKWKKIEDNEENIRRIFPDHLVENIFIKIKEIKEKMLSLDNWCLDDEHKMEIRLKNEQFFELEEKEKCLYAKQNGIELKLLGNLGFIEIVTDSGTKIKMPPLEFLVMEAINKRKWAFENVLNFQLGLNDNEIEYVTRNLVRKGVIQREKIEGGNDYVLSMVI